MLTQEVLESYFKYCCRIFVHKRNEVIFTVVFLTLELNTKFCLLFNATKNLGTIHKINKA